MTEVALAQWFSDKGLAFEAYEHAPLMTCEDVIAQIGHLPGQRTKNLFMANRKGDQYVLCCVPNDKSVDIKALGKSLDLKGLHFASEEQLVDGLSIRPGSVTMLAMVQADVTRVRLVVDQGLWQAHQVQCHPLHNRATWVLSQACLRTFFDHLDVAPAVIDVPSRQVDK